MINNILDHSKLQAGKLIISPRPVDVRPFLKKIGKMFYAKAKSKNLKILLKLSKLIPQKLIFDE
jgi:signal transduction histidine kinase